jgi:Tol biopolymer transport system component
VTASGSSVQPQLSEDGRFVVFSSFAKDLTPGLPASPFLNVYLHDRLSGQTTLVTTGTNGLGGDGSSVGAMASGDGRYVAYQSFAGNLAARDGNQASDVFLWDRLAATTVLVSRELSGDTATHRGSVGLCLSTNGRWLVYESDAAGLVINDTNAATDVFLFDRESGQNLLVSVNDAGNGSRGGSSHSAAITPDGQWVAFLNGNATNVAAGISHLLVRRFPSGETVRATETIATELSGYLGALHPAWSADGAFLYFAAFNSVTTNLYRYATATGVAELVALSCQARSSPSASASGQRVAYERNNLLYVWDALTGMETLASATIGGAPAPQSDNPRAILSADGSRLTFFSDAGGLTSHPTNGYTQLYQRNLGDGAMWLLSADTNNTAAGELSASFAAVTPDGLTVAFESNSSRMMAADANDAVDIFVRTPGLDTIALISRRDVGLDLVTAPGAAMLYPNSVSREGRVVVYGARDFEAIGDTNGVQDIFVRDLDTGLVTPVSVSATGIFTNQFSARNCAISGDGRRVVWSVPRRILAEVPRSWRDVFWKDLVTGETRLVESDFVDPLYLPLGRFTAALNPDGRWIAFDTTRNLSRPEESFIDADFTTDLLLHDVIAGTNMVISQSWDGTRTGTSPSYLPLFSPDGRWLAFVSSAGNLTTNAVAGVSLFVRDLVNHVTRNIGATPLVNPMDRYPGSVGGAVFSGDSRYLACHTVNGYVDLYELATGLRSNVCSQCANPTLNHDGRFLAVSARAADGVGPRVRVYDRVAGRATVVGTNLSSGAMAGRATRDPVLSGDGRYLVFLADYFNGARAADPALYVRDLVRGLTMPLPVDQQGGSGDGAFFQPQFAGDGRTLVFASWASDLVAGDYNNTRDVFAVRVGSPDADGDQLDDDWEMAYFNTLNRDGLGDFDHDGQTDADEFRAGTDPTNAGSVLSTMIVANLGAQTVTVSWNSVPGRTYEVQSKDSLADTWSTLRGAVLANSSTTSVTDATAPRPPRRFYRVLFTP